MKATIPIYLADVTVKITKKTGRISTQTRYVLLKGAIVKGFTLKDISKRKQSLADKTIKNSDTETAKIVNLVLRSQHGYGVDEKY